MVTLNKTGKRADGTEFQFSVEAPADAQEARAIFKAFNDRTALRVVKQHLTTEARIAASKPEEEVLASALRKGNATPEMLERLAQVLRDKSNVRKVA